jgi:hypothetical protein
MRSLVESARLIMFTPIRRTTFSNLQRRTEFLGFTFAEYWAMLLLTFLVLFPKGGVKVGSIPLTWGYLLLGVTGFIAVPWWVARISFQVRRSVLLVLGSLFPIQALIIYSLLANGAADTGFAISTCLSLFGLPVFFLILVPQFLQSSIRKAKLLKGLRMCIFLTAVYGVFLFFWHIYSGHFIEIPYLTVNAADVGLLETTKDIDRGGLFKLISTYNNGNVYGAAILILLPLFDVIEPRKWRKLFLRLALALTLSRSVWIGMVLLQLLYLLRDLKRDFRDFPLIRLGTSAKSLLLLLPAAVGVAFGMVLMSTGLGVLLDTSFGGRASELAAFTNTTVLPSVPVDAFLEIVYASAAQLFGYAGLVAMVLFLTFPIVIYFTDPSARVGRLKNAAFTGLLVYVFMCGMDGAFDYIPVMAFYWFAYMIFLYGDIDLRSSSEVSPAVVPGLPRSAAELGGLTA